MVCANLCGMCISVWYVYICVECVYLCGMCKSVWYSDIVHVGEGCLALNGIISCGGGVSGVKWHCFMWGTCV